MHWFMSFLLNASWSRYIIGFFLLIGLVIGAFVATYHAGMRQCELNQTQTTLKQYQDRLNVNKETDSLSNDAIDNSLRQFKRQAGEARQ